MRYVPWLTAAVFSLSPALSNAEQQNADDPYSKLAFFEGQWTVEGQESTYKEVCEWFPNRRFLICKAEDKEGGTPTWTMSIFGHSTEKRAYTHTLFGGSGLSRTIHGWLNGSIWTFTGETQAGDDTKRMQITIKPTRKGFVVLAAALALMNQLSPLVLALCIVVEGCGGGSYAIIDGMRTHHADPAFAEVFII